MMEPVGHASRHPACSQCLQTSEENSHVRASAALPPRPMRGSLSTNFTCRHVECPSARVLSYDLPLQRKPSSGTPFHSLHATSHALQPMQSVESVKKPVTVTAGIGVRESCRGFRRRKPVATGIARTYRLPFLNSAFEIRIFEIPRPT